MVVVLGLQRRYLLYALFGLFFNVALNLVLLPPYGFIAAAWITLATELLVVGLGWRAVLGELHFRPQTGRIWRAAAATVAMTLVLFGLRALGAPAEVLIAAAARQLPGPGAADPRHQRRGDSRAAGGAQGPVLIRTARCLTERASHPA